MLQVINHVTGSIEVYTSLPEALTAARLLANHLARTQSLPTVVEEPSPGEVAFMGELQDDTGRGLGAAPLVFLVWETPERRRWEVPSL